MPFRKLPRILHMRKVFHSTRELDYKKFNLLAE